MRAAILAAPLAAAALLPGSAASGRQKPYVLTALAGIGTVYWRYDCVHYRAPEWSLGIRVFPTTATTRVTLRTGQFTRSRTIQPGYPKIWFPFRSERRQRFSFVQGTEAGILKADVVARFRGRTCEPYFPPRLTVQLYPR